MRPGHRTRRPVGRGGRPRVGRHAGLTAALLLIGLPSTALASGVLQAQLPDGAFSVDQLTFEELVFEPPVVARHDLGGVPVMLLEDAGLPLVTVFAHFRGGYGLFDRRYYAPAMGLPALLRYGGTASRTPEAVDEAAEHYALRMSFGTAGGSITSSVNVLTEHLPVAIDLWGEMLAEPRFEQREIDSWRGRQLEGVLRRVDDPGRLAFSEMNRLLFGDHPIGWEMDAEDLDPARVAPERFGYIHRRIVCRENLVLGVAGDARWGEVRRLLRGLVDRLPSCAEDLPDAPVPQIRRAPGVFLIDRELEQAVIVMAHPTDVRLGDDDAYYAATIGNSILGAGGFSSRLLGRLRTDEGFAYSATSLWTTPRDHEGIVGATTRTRPENTVPAIEAILETMSGLQEAPPTPDEVATTVDRIVNGFVFNFDSPARIVSRTMSYLAQELPEDWLERYVRGVQRVRPGEVRDVFSEHLHPEEMTILVVGDPARIGEDLRALGPVTVWEVR